MTRQVSELIVDLLSAETHQSDVDRLVSLLADVRSDEVEPYEVAQLVEREFPSWPTLASCLRSQAGAAELLFTLLPRMRALPAV